MRKPCLIVLILSVLSMLAADPLRIGPDDYRIIQSLEGGYYLYVRAVDGLGSILLTESTEDPERRAASYALRNPDYHPVNGDEKRMLDGEFLELRDFYSLIDSSPEHHPELGPVFTVFIPWVVEYGNPWARSGELQVMDGTYLSIRAFEKPYADYRGRFRDNPFIVRVSQLEIREDRPDTSIYMQETVEAFTEIAGRGGGVVKYSAGPEDIVDLLAEIISDAEGQSLDLVLAIDTTASMRDDMPYIQRKLVPVLGERLPEYSELRVGVVLYKDYFEEYLTDVYPFQPTLDTVQRIVDRIRVYGGRDIPEAVYEALYDGVHRFPWAAERRMIILVGDAPPHPRPRGSVTDEMVYSGARARNIELHTVILAH